ncbi:MAG: sigma-70 family RNA polymerase sigma factor [Planctomycetaceae bacterium]|nr:sigma-70 family RNA polymerase sigma factor [Planctomycetaceae bacterium]
MDYKAESDEWLMQQVKTGRRDCLEALVRRYATPLLTYLHRISGARHTAEDLLQETFLAVWARRETFAATGTFASWLFAIATNCHRQSLRSRSRRLVMFDTSDSIPAVPCTTPTPLDQSLIIEQQRALELAISRLPEQQREVLVMRHWNRMPHAEIAKVVDCTVATVRSHLHHALKNIRRYMESHS